MGDTWPPSGSLGALKAESKSVEMVFEAVLEQVFQQGPFEDPFGDWGVAYSFATSLASDTLP